jgi:hypothetical protein
MIPKDRKRLAEVDFPIAVVSAHAAHEKSIRHGHPSALHLCWARQPLASCRAMLLALLLPDPCDEPCPAAFKDRARELFQQPMLPGKKPTTPPNSAPGCWVSSATAPFVEKGDFGLASGQSTDGYQRVWFQEWVSPEVISFEPNVFLFTARARSRGESDKSIVRR